MILVSACLLGQNCRYDGRNNLCPLLSKFPQDRLLPICPEELGGLATPRRPVELVPGNHEGVCKAIDCEGKDVTREFLAGAGKVCQLARETGAKAAILKERSPSCGTRLVYDGTFKRRTIPGQGLTARALAAAGIRIVSDEDLSEALIEQLMADLD
jgi:uncharacterized protein YbbK (DUF523 family)